MALRWHLQLLGGHRLRDERQHEHAMPSRRAWALLACVAVERQVPRIELAERLWPGLELAAARRNLRRELARLRDAGLHELLDAGADAITLGAAVGSDLDAFIAASARGDGAAAMAAWSGPLLQGFVLAEAPAFEAWLDQRRDELTQRWRLAALTHAEQLERDGALRDALRWHDCLRADDPLQERHYLSAMRLHHRLGEAEAALEVYAQCQRTLRTELGTAPSAAAAALAERVRALAALAPQITRPPLAAATVPLELPLVGRDTEMAAVERSTAALLLVLGEAGVGKTRLVQETLRAPNTLAVYCDAEARQSPLYPVAEALQAALASPERRARLAAVPAAQRQQAAALLPALADELPATLPRAGSDAEAAHEAARRERFFDALADTIDAIAGPAGTLWVDDLHGADDATVDLVGHLARRRGHGGAAHVRLVVTARTLELEAREPAAAALRRLQRARLVEPIPLAPLAPQHTLALLRAVSGLGLDSGSVFAARLQRATRGNAFHLAETLRHLLATGEVRVQPDGRWSTPHDDPADETLELPLPPTLAATVRERVARMSAAARQLIEAAVHARGGFTLAQLQPATALGDWDALDGLEEALRMGLFAELAARAEPAQAAAAAVPRYRLAHELTREALRPTVRPERRRLIHQRLARALAEQREAADHIAWHLEEAGLADQAVAWRLAAAEHARSVTSWRDALAHLRQAWAAAPDDAGLRLRIVRERIDAARCAFDLAAMADAVNDFQALALQARSAAAELEACVLHAELGQLKKSPAAAIAPLQSALAAHAADAAIPASLKARAVAALGHALLAGGQVDAAEEALAAFDDAEPGIEPRWRAAVLGARANAARLAQQPSRAQPLFEQAIALLQAPEHVDARLTMQNMLAHTHFMQGRVDRAIETLEVVLRQAEQARLTMVLRAVLPNLATLAVNQGQLDAARRHLERAVAALQGADDAATQAMLASRLAELRLTAGELGGALAAARQSIALYEANGGGSHGYPPWMMCFHLYRHAGLPAQAEQVLGSLLASPARSPGGGPEALARLMSLAARLAAATRAQARSIAVEIEHMHQAPDAAFGRTEAEFWRAHALHRAGRHAEAAALAASLPEAELGLQQHPAALLALRLACASAAGRFDPALADAAEAALDKAPALARLELMQALSRSHGAASTAGRAWAERLNDWVETLAAGLADEPELAAGLRRTWRVMASASGRGPSLSSRTVVRR